MTDPRPPHTSPLPPPTDLEAHCRRASIIETERRVMGIHHEGHKGHEVLKEAMDLIRELLTQRAQYEADLEATRAEINRLRTNYSLSPSSDPTPSTPHHSSSLALQKGCPR